MEFLNKQALILSDEDAGLGTKYRLRNTYIYSQLKQRERSCGRNVDQKAVSPFIGSERKPGREQEDQRCQDRPDRRTNYPGRKIILPPSVLPGVRLLNIGLAGK